MRILRTLLTDITTLGLSFILALIIWVVAVRASDPITTKSLELEILERGLLPAEGEVTMSEELVRITVEGPQSVVNPLTRSDFSAYIDKSEIPFGSSETPVLIDVAAEGIQVVFQEPQMVSVVAEEIISREIPVAIEIRGSAARGHTIGEANSDPPSILVSGPEQRINQLNEARITVFLEQPREDVVAIRRPTFVNQELSVVSISGLTTSTDEVRINIPINEIAGVAEKPITVDWNGSPALGYRLLNVSVEPTSTLISGTPTTIDEIRSISTESIDISGLNMSITQQVTLVFPEGATAEEVVPVFVTIEIEPILTTDVVRGIPELRALGDGLVAEVTPEEVSIFLFGPLPALDSIGDSDVTVTLDLLDLEPGEYQIKPLVSVSANEVEIRSTEPETMTVLIRELTEEELAGEIAPGDGSVTPIPEITPAP